MPRPTRAPGAAALQAPLRLGGRGLRSQEQLAPAAWAAAWAQSLAALRERTGLASLDNLETSPLPLAAACRDSLAELAALPPPPRRWDADGPDRLPTWAELATEPQKKLQRTLTARIDQKNFTSLLGSLDSEEDRALLRSCGGPHAAA